MSLLSELLTPTGALAAVGGLLYVSVLGGVAVTSVLAPTPQHRRDARATLAILMRRRAR
ncbi:hypothetical protein [Streptomyces sedi]|uniref:hypothetical protein n=1 Tax=Streptomyces sedi TaxID=555059 RepID=UPI0014768FB1|nr:hypothetical protein [Streptomyces sedi]